MKRLFQFVFFLSTGLALTALTGCADSCNGSIETTVLYAKPGPKAVGRSIYVNVVNKPNLGIKQSLMYEARNSARSSTLSSSTTPPTALRQTAPFAFRSFGREWSLPAVI